MGNSNLDVVIYSESQLDSLENNALVILFILNCIPAKEACWKTSALVVTIAIQHHFSINLIYTICS